MAATKRQQIANFLTSNGFASTFQGDLFEQAVNAIELYTNKKENKKKPSSKLSDEDMQTYNGFAMQLLTLFPKIKIPTSGKYARDPQKEVVEALIWFNQTYPDFTMSCIIMAVTKYVKEYELKNWEYMQTIKYFIRKQQKDRSWISNLANYCQQVKDGVVDANDIKLPATKVV